jgi:hypothetical protein
MSTDPAHGPHGSDRGAAFTGLILGAIVLFALLFAIVKLTSARYEGPTAVAAARRTAPAAGPSDTVITHDPGPLTWGYHGGSSPQGYSPVQPIAFPHPKHVKALGMNCVYCHYAAYKSPDPGLPAVGTCMGCHLYTFSLAQRPEIVKLTAYWNAKKPIPWVRIHRLPEYVHFPHMRHVNVGVTCQTCHGQVQEMYRVYQAASLNMGWCITCHINGYTAAQGDLAAGSARALGPAGASSRANATPLTFGGAPALTAAVVTARYGVSIGPPLTDERHRARYDCAVCHF